MNNRLIDTIIEIVESCGPDKVAVLTDSNVVEIERPLIEALGLRIQERGITLADVIVTPAGEENKTPEALFGILGRMSGCGMTRRSLLICVGGGMTTDVGGFAAAIFKRGIRHVNVATTLLAAVDAAVGGKTAIDFQGLKNEIGAFHLPVASLADAESFGSLPPTEILSGFGEIVKTAFISDAEMTERVLAVDPLDATVEDLDIFCDFCRREKMRIVEADPTEKGLRKVLNFGHTAGHAIESLLIEKGLPMAHGSAIAHGNLVALILSHLHEGLDREVVTRYSQWLRRNYPIAQFSCSDYDRLLALASHDKKNTTDKGFSFTLLQASGQPVHDRLVTPEQLRAALDIYQELQGR